MRNTIGEISNRPVETHNGGIVSGNLAQAHVATDDDVVDQRPVWSPTKEIAPSLASSAVRGKRSGERLTAFKTRPTLLVPKR